MSTVTYRCTLWDSIGGPSNFVMLKLAGPASLQGFQGGFGLRDISGGFVLTFPVVFLPARPVSFQFSAEATMPSRTRFYSLSASLSAFCQQATTSSYSEVELQTYATDSGYRFSGLFEGINVESSAFVPFHVGLLWKRLAFVPVNPVQIDGGLRDLIFTKVSLEIDYRRPEIPRGIVLNTFDLGPGSRLLDLRTNEEVEFIGFELEPSVGQGETRSIFGKRDGSVVVEAFDARIFRPISLSKPAEDEVVEDGKAEALVSRLVKRSSQQRIRGVPLLDLFHYLSFGTGVYHQVAVVGGAVRDALRNQVVSDIDVVVTGCEYGTLHRYLVDFFASRGVTVNDAILRASGKGKKFGMLKIMRDPVTDADDLDIGLCKAGLHPVPQPPLASPYCFANSFRMDALTRDYTQFMWMWSTRLFMIRLVDFGKILNCAVRYVSIMSEAVHWCFSYQRICETISVVSFAFLRNV
jgi:hypothetical protein